MRRQLPFALTVLLAVSAGLGCAAESPATRHLDGAPAVADPSAAITLRVVDGSRPAHLYRPADYAALDEDPTGGGRRWPLVVALHGYTHWGLEERGVADYLGLKDEVGRAGILLLVPEGTRDAAGDRFWNASPACCDLHASGIDDVAYLLELVARVVREEAVDEDRIYAVGHSNGGFMAYRLACQAGTPFTAIASLAGAAESVVASCNPARPVGVLQIHGDADEVVLFGGSPTGIRGLPSGYPGAEESVSRWAERNGCSAQIADDNPFDVTLSVEGAETVATRYLDCRGGVETTLWRMRGERHVPKLGPAFARRVLDALLRQARRANAGA